MTKTKKQSYNKNGVVLFENDNIAVIATGLLSKSTNTKTGGMVQIYIIYRHMSPMAAVQSGLDVHICGNCPHRGKIIDGVLIDRRCYVNLGKGARAVYMCYERGGYRRATVDEYPALFGGREVRLGTYGDPAYIPPSIIAAITASCSRWTGYTHQWRTNQWLAPFVMASADSPADRTDAAAAGWRTFRVAPLTGPDSLPMLGEIACPASAEAGKRTTCEDCLLCDGARPADPRKSIVIRDHSVIAKSRPMLIQIAA